jgi:Fic family protein
MKWTWQLKNWPNYEFDYSELASYEIEFQRNIGKVYGSLKHFDDGNNDHLKIEILTQEALSTSEIEGELLNRDSVQSSIKRQLGLQTTRNKANANEAGIAELMVDVYTNFDQKLNKSTLCNWHRMVCNGRRDLDVIGDYRKHKEPMQIVSGNISNQKLYYEAPPSKLLNKEMDAFIKWYNTNLKNEVACPTLVFAGITHLYFEMIHPFEDGNGRIGRALVEKAISQRINAPSLNSFAKVIETKKKKYYDALQGCNHTLEITPWLIYFSKTTIASQEYTDQLIQFLINKTKFFLKYKSLINERQEKVLLRIFEEGINGFKGGLSAGNYLTITGTSPATATRDLQDLVELGALRREGELRYARYWVEIL